MIASEEQILIILWRAVCLFRALKAFLASTRRTASVSSFWKADRTAWTAASVPQPQCHRRRTRWWCLKCVIVYLARAIQAFVMYCVNGTSRSSLLIESTDSMIYIYRENFAQQYRKCGARSGSRKLTL